MPCVPRRHTSVMTDAAIAAREKWAAEFADQLVGFSPAPYPEVDEGDLPTAPATRLAHARKRARDRAQRARERARRASELDGAIASGLRSILQQRGVYDRLRDGEDLGKVAVMLEPVLGTAMAVLVEECGWDRTAASKALNRRLLRPEASPAAKA